VVRFELPQTLSGGESWQLTILLACLSILVAVLGISLAERTYFRHVLTAPEAGGLRAVGLQNWYNAAGHLYYMDDFYSDVLVSPTMSASAMAGDFDNWFVDGVLVNGAAYVTVWFSRINDWFDRMIVDGIVRLVAGASGLVGETLRKVQQGIIQIYALVVFVSVFALIVVVRYLR
jgi:NADH:ubiquinone oxidoreductase subunit 5 (subunit L)/multisubunit Na+/H+ antiporter MnhA subunit